MTLLLGEGFIDIWAKRDGVWGGESVGRFADEAFEPSLSLFPPPQRRRLALAGRRIMRAKQKDNSPIRGRRKSGQMGVKNSYLKMYLPSGSAVQGSRHPPGKLAVYPRFQPCVRPPPPHLPPLPTAPRRFIWRRRNRGSRRARHRLLQATHLSPHSSSSPVSLPAAGACVSEHGWGGARARAKEAASPFFPAAFSNLSRATPCGEGRGGENCRESPLQNSRDPCGRLDCCRLDR